MRVVGLCAGKADLLAESYVWFAYFTVVYCFLRGWIDAIRIAVWWRKVDWSTVDARTRERGITMDEAYSELDRAMAGAINSSLLNTERRVSSVLILLDFVVLTMAAFAVTLWLLDCSACDVYTNGDCSNILMPLWLGLLMKSFFFVLRVRVDRVLRSAT
jgi:hypothetical protein